MLAGLMQEEPLLISSIIAHAARYHGDTEIVSRTVEGDIHRYTYAEARSARAAAGAGARAARRARRATASRRWPGTATAISSSTTPSPAWAR